MKAHKKLMASLAALKPKPADLIYCKSPKAQAVIPIIYKRLLIGSEQRRLSHEKRRESRRENRLAAAYARMDREDLV